MLAFLGTLAFIAIIGIIIKLVWPIIKVISLIVGLGICIGIFMSAIVMLIIF